MCGRIYHKMFPDFLLGQRNGDEELGENIRQHHPETTHRNF